MVLHFDFFPLFMVYKSNDSTNHRRHYRHHSRLNCVYISIIKLDDYVKVWLSFFHSAIHAF